MRNAHASRNAVSALFILMQAGLALGAGNRFSQTVLVANLPEYNPTAFVDPHMTDAWGIALRPPGAGGHIWISNAQDGTTTTYQGDVNGVPLHQDGLKVIPINQPQWTDHGYAQVTGQVYNAASDVPGQPIEFPVSGEANNWSTIPPTPVGVTSGPAKFVFVTLEGTIAAWRSSTNPGMVSAVLMKDFSLTSTAPWPFGIHAVFTGVAMTTDAFTVNGQGQSVANNRLYAADFENGRVQVFDNQWNDISDTTPFDAPPDLPQDFHPFNIQWLNGHLFVTYAKLDVHGEETGEDIHAPGLGRLAEFDRDGHLIAQFDDAGMLNSPWGVAFAPSGFGPFGGDLLVANFGDGTIAAFDPNTHRLVDYLRDNTGRPVSIDGLWGLTFGNGVSLGDANALYFTAGPNNEEDGMFGRLNACDSTCGPACGSADFNGDGDLGTDLDIAAFFECLGGNCCATCLSADFNGDGDLGTDADIESFFRVLGGGGC
jgi:uncharacterized protein (TIGR03118 family)